MIFHSRSRRLLLSNVTIEMKVFVTGLNHKTATVDIRERLAFDKAQAITALRQLKSRFPEAEFVLLSTCNRIELYCAGHHVDGPAPQELVKFLSRFHNVAVKDFQDFVYVHNDSDAVTHLLTVASSLDSMVVGEGQILGQVKESYGLACTAKTTGKVLNRLFHCSFTTSKKIHTTTRISSGRISVAGVAVELATQLFADITSAEIVVIGAGEMGELLLQHLRHARCSDITIVNRSLRRAEEMAGRYGVEAGKWQDLGSRIKDADIIIASAAGQDYLFRKDSFRKMMGARRKGALLVIDIAVPRNFEPTVNEIENVYLYSVDDLSEVAEENRKAREDNIAKGMQIIYENAVDFMDWFRGRDIGPLLGKMREKFVRLSEDELERFFAGSRQEALSRNALEPVVKRIVNKLVHCIIKNVDTVAKEHGPAEAAKLIDNIIRDAEEVLSKPGNKEDMQS